MPGALVIAGGSGRRSSFEITVGNDESSRKVLYSKLASGTFPDGASVKAALEQFIKDGTIPPIEEDKSGGCSVQ